MDAETLLALPGGDLVGTGIADLARGEETDEALLVSMASVRLAELGLEIPRPFESPRELLYDRLAERNPDGGPLEVQGSRPSARALPAGGCVRERVDATRGLRLLSELGRRAERVTVS